MGNRPPLLMIAVYRKDPPWKLDAEYVEKIRAVAGERFEVFQAASREDVKSRLGEAEIILGWRVAPEDLPEAANLKWVQSTSAGVEGSLYPEFAESDVILTNSSGIHAVQISEQAIGMMIALTRSLPAFMRSQLKKTWTWERDEAPLGELYQKTLAVIGLGAIGEGLAVRAKAFGMRVLGVKNSPLGYKGAADEVVGPDAIKRVLHEADYVVALLPHTERTHGLISAEAIAAMRPGAYFLNFGRGATVDEEALVKALEEGRIAGAGLDVFAEEPLPEDSRLWNMENVIITPHVSGISPRYWERATGLFCENLRRWIEGRDLLNVVDKAVGY